VEDADLRAILNRNPMLAADSEGLRVAAAQVALLRAMHKHDLRRALVFCPRIAVADVFAETLGETAALMPKRMQSPLQVGTVNCNQSRYERLTAVSAFKEASLTASDKKNRSGTLSFILPTGIGTVQIVRDVTPAELLTAAESMFTQMRQHTAAPKSVAARKRKR